MSVFSSTASVILAAIVLMIAVAFFASAAIPDQIDWRDRGMVGPVFNQGACGNAGDFAAVDNIASTSGILNQRYTALSVAELEKCNPRGCRGGSMLSAYKWILSDKGSNGTLAALSSFTNTTQCADRFKLPIGAKILSVVHLGRNVEDVKKAVAEEGPIFVGVDARNFQEYTGGIFTCKSNGPIDDAAVIVGYNFVTKPPYWIVKMAWGKNFGEDGYIRIDASTRDDCSITKMPITVRATKLHF